MVVPFVLAALILFFGVAGRVARRRLLRQVPRPGRLVDVGGYHLHIHALGQGGPAVIFDAGAGATGLAWAPMQRDVAAFTNAVVYDRAGRGWSMPGRTPRTNHLMVEELHALLHNAGIPTPYVLVGHSLGGLNVRLYAHTYPQDVAGLVLVDAVHEEQFSPQPIKETMARMARMMPLVNGIQRLLVTSGLPALRPSLLQATVDGAFGRGPVPEEIRTAYRNLIAANPGHHAAFAAEMKAIDQSHARLREERVSLPSTIPLVVISHGRAEESPMLAPDVARLAEETFQKCQREMASQSPLGKQIIATESGHNIPFEQPELVLAAIREIVERARTGQLAAPVPAPLTGVEA
jgi:pimeloyl-ACP methyl ester carboxylesterase